MKNLKKLVQKTLIDEAWFTENAEGMGVEPFLINDAEDTNNYVNDIMENVIDDNDDFDAFSKKQIKAMVREVYLELADEYNKKTIENSKIDSDLLEPEDEIVFNCEKQPGWNE